MYLNCVMDLFAKKTISRTLSNNTKVTSIIKTIIKAKAVRNTDLPLSIHSDRGSQYVSSACRETTDNFDRNTPSYVLPCVFNNALLNFFPVISRIVLLEQ